MTQQNKLWSIIIHIAYTAILAIWGIILFPQIVGAQTQNPTPTPSPTPITFDFSILSQAGGIKIVNTGVPSGSDPVEIRLPEDIGITILPGTGVPSGSDPVEIRLSEDFLEKFGQILENHGQIRLPSEIVRTQPFTPQFEGDEPIQWGVYQFNPSTSVLELIHKGSTLAQTGDDGSIVELSDTAIGTDYFVLGSTDWSAENPDIVGEHFDLHDLIGFDAESYAVDDASVLAARIGNVEEPLIQEEMVDFALLTDLNREVVTTNKPLVNLVLPYKEYNSVTKEVQIYAPGAFLNKRLAELGSSRLLPEFPLEEKQYYLGVKVNGALEDIAEMKVEAQAASD